jgi:hypothetical protein
MKRTGLGPHKKMRSTSRAAASSYSLPIDLLLVDFYFSMRLFLDFSCMTLWKMRQNLPLSGT